MVGPLKNGSNGEDAGLSSSFPGKSSGAFLSSLFRSKSRDSDKDGDSTRVTGSSSTPGVSAPPVLASNGNHGTSTQHPHNTTAKPVFKGTESSSSSSSSHWLLNRKPSEKKKDRPERLKNALFGHGSGSSSSASKEVKGAVKVSGCT